MRFASIPYSENLHKVFSQNFTVMDLADPLLSFNFDTDAKLAKSLMDERYARAALVRVDGQIKGFILKDELTDGCISNVQHEFNLDELLFDNTPMMDAIPSILEDKISFVVVLGEVTGVLSLDSIQKPAFRMWLFGAINLIEMSYTNTIRKYLGADTAWQQYISEDRLKKTEWILNERRRRRPGLDIDLIDCLQFGDKAAIIFKNEDLRERYQFKSRNKAKSEVKHLEQLRNALAHGQFLDIDDLGEGINIIITRLNSVMMQQRLKSNDLASTLTISDPDMLKKLQGLENIE